MTNKPARHTFFAVLFKLPIYHSFTLTGLNYHFYCAIIAAYLGHLCEFLSDTRNRPPRRYNKTLILLLREG